MTLSLSIARSILPLFTIISSNLPIKIFIFFLLLLVFICRISIGGIHHEAAQKQDHARTNIREQRHHSLNVKPYTHTNYKKGNKAKKPAKE